MGEFLVFLLVGLVVGVIARLLMPGPDPIGILGTILVAMGLLYVYRRMTFGRRSTTL